MSELKIKELWIFDINYRMYRRDKDGRSYGSPIWREHWRKHEVVSETSRSWITKWGKKVPKKGGHGIAFDEAEIDRQAYIKENRRKLGDIVDRLDDCELLKKVAELVGYQEDKT